MIEYQDTPADPEAYLPYAGTSGWSGTDTSKERAERDDSSGTTNERQSATLKTVAWSQGIGVTVKELREHTGMHHGQASSALSVLHMGGKLVRLKERRDRCEVYVTPEYVHGREVSPHRTNKAKDALEEVRAQALAWVATGHSAVLGKYACRHCAGQAILDTIEGRTKR